jgi:signal transduction histidine kinase
LRADGSFFGTLCAIDPTPRVLKQDRILAMFRLFARMIGEILDNDEALSQSRAALTQERALAEQQEQFIAILAHDLRNPVNALTAGLRMIERRINDPQSSLNGALTLTLAHRWRRSLPNCRRLRRTKRSSQTSTCPAP